MSLGKIAYDRYFEACGGRSLISGQTLPAWDQQDERIQEAWSLAAQAVADQFRWAFCDFSEDMVIRLFPTEAAGQEVAVNQLLEDGVLKPIGDGKFQLEFQDCVEQYDTLEQAFDDFQMSLMEHQYHHVYEVST